MSIQIAIGGDLQVATSGADWATVECTNGAASDWEDEVVVDGDGLSNIAGVITSPHEQGFYLRWNNEPEDYRLVVVTISGGGSGTFALSNVSTGRLVTNGGTDWLNLESSHKCRVLEIKFFAPPTGQGRFTRTSASAITGADHDDRINQILEWIDENLNVRAAPMALLGSSGGADAILAPFTQDTTLAHERIRYIAFCSCAQPFWDFYLSCQDITPAGTRVDPATGNLTSDPGDDGPPFDHFGYGTVEYILTDDRCETQTITEGDSVPYSDRSQLAPLVPSWYSRTAHFLVGTGGVGDTDLGGNVWATGNLMHDPFWERARRLWFHSAADSHGDSLSDIFSDGFAEVHAELAALADAILGGTVSKGNTFENDWQKLIFNATAIANIADNAASSPLTNLQVSLHTADPGEAGDQTTNEATYTSYARVAVARTSGGWTVTNNSVSPVADITFPAGTGGSGTVTHFAVGTASSGSGKILYSGTVTPNIVTGNGITPVLTTASTITED